ncbi:MAG: sugar kinase [Alphaproteobacteria bacterium]|nr:sugar kinase [Alphaproteobacteria bacterium]
MVAPSPRIACLGECMIELRERQDGLLSRGQGGDTLNTAVYLARLGARVDYVTALGDDAWSEEMLAGWRAEGVGTDRVVRLPGRVPGLYIIQTDARGERRFSYWRDSAPARDLFRAEAATPIVAALVEYDLVYLSGITLSLYGEAGRGRLFALLDEARRRGHRLAFDTNFRPRGWPDRQVAQAAFRSAMSRADILLASIEDLALLFGDQGEAEFLSVMGPAERVLKLANPACRVIGAGEDQVINAEPVTKVVDTTAAGDSFAAAYVSARLAGRSMAEAARAGHRLAGAVVGHPGALIPIGAMPSDLRFW